MKDIKRRLIVDSIQATEFLLLNRDIWGGGGGGGGGDFVNFMLDALTVVFYPKLCRNN